MSQNDFQGRPDLDDEPKAPVDSVPSSEPFIPPQADPLPKRVMRVEDFPPNMQRQIAPRPEEDRGARSLLKRLANVGLGRREEEGAVPAAESHQTDHRPTPSQPPRAQPQQAYEGHRPPGAPAAEQPQRMNPGMYQPRRGDLDAQGRAQPRDTRLDEGELEIPAFLRRQAN